MRQGKAGRGENENEVRSVSMNEILELVATLRMFLSFRVLLLARDVDEIGDRLSHAHLTSPSNINLLGIVMSEPSSASRQPSLSIRVLRYTRSPHDVRQKLRSRLCGLKPSSHTETGRNARKLLCVQNIADLIEIIDAR